MRDPFGGTLCMDVGDPLEHGICEPARLAQQLWGHALSVLLQVGILLIGQVNGCLTHSKDLSGK